MAQLYLLKGLLLAGSLLLATAGAAQVAPAAADSVPQSPQVLYKLGLRICATRTTAERGNFCYPSRSGSSTGWRPTSASTPSLRPIC